MTKVKPQSSEPLDDEGAPGTLAVEPEPAPEPEPPKDPTKVRYVGQATERRITTQDWALAGVPDEPMLVLGRGETIPLDRLSRAAQEVLGRDGNFKFE